MQAPVRWMGHSVEPKASLLCDTVLPSSASSGLKVERQPCVFDHRLGCALKIIQLLSVAQHVVDVFRLGCLVGERVFFVAGLLSFCFVCLFTFLLAIIFTVS